MDTLRKYLRLKANPENLAVVRGFVRLNSVTLGTGRDQIGDIVIAVDEAVTNIIMHGYQNQGGTVELELVREGNYLVIYIRDQAPPFDPLSAPPPPTDIPLEERPLGGLGVHLIRKAMDSVEYHLLADGSNELVMKKHI